MSDFITCKPDSKKPPERCDYCVNCECFGAHYVNGNRVCNCCGGLRELLPTIYETSTHRITKTFGPTGRPFLDVFPLGSDICGDSFYLPDWRSTSAAITLHCHMVRSVPHEMHEANAVFGSSTTVSVSWGIGNPRIVSDVKAMSSDAEDYFTRGDEPDHFPSGMW